MTFLTTTRLLSTFSVMMICMINAMNVWMLGVRDVSTLRLVTVSEHEFSDETTLRLYV